MSTIPPNWLKLNLKDKKYIWNFIKNSLLHVTTLASNRPSILSLPLTSKRNRKTNLEHKNIVFRQNSNMVFPQPVSRFEDFQLRPSQQFFDFLFQRETNEWKPVQHSRRWKQRLRFRFKEKIATFFVAPFWLYFNGFRFFLFLTYNPIIEITF